MLRIRKARWRFAYVVVGIALLLTLNGFILSRVLPGPVDAVIYNLLILAFIFVAVRSFRGSGELVEPPRAWWRMTSRPTSGLLIAAYLTASVVTYLFSTTAQAPGDGFTNALSTAVNALLIALYVHSSIRLVVAAPEPVPQEVAQEVGQETPLRSP